MAETLVWVEIVTGVPVRIFKNHKLACLSGAEIAQMAKVAAVGFIRHAVFVRDNFCCTHCGLEVSETVPWYEPHAAHMHEREWRGRGGEISLDNSTTLCKNCHLYGNIGHGNRKPQW